MCGEDLEIPLKTAVVRLQSSLESLGVFAETLMAGRCPSASDLVGLGQGLRICMANQFLGEPDFLGGQAFFFKT